MNQTIQNKKISPETQNTIETIAKKYNQTTNDTNNATAPTEPDNTTNNNSGNNKVIDPTNDNPNDNHDNNTPTHNDAICGLDGAIAGFSLLGYSLLSITKFWNIYKTGNIAETMTSYFIHHLNKLRNPVVSEATAAVPEAAAADSLKMIDMIPYLSLSNANTVRSTLIRNIMKYPSTAGDISNMAKISIMKDTVLNPLNENIENYLMGLQELDFNSYIYLSAKSKYGARGAVDELFILASENPETFYKIAGYAGDFGKAVETASVKFCKQCTVIADVGTFMSAVSVVLDVWMVASIVSWAGKEFGWWSKDYVNDWLPF
ncbi:MAG: hypothetical protein NKF70_13135 [Methanobacterium sp. ERen5]|nr:MAG: hypothetical protein NKF70_13135 [Methanobacterium sp. ERen5]